jgi:hypothetical protein
MCILRGFLKVRIFVFSIVQRRHVHENGQNRRFAMEMTLRGTHRGSLYGEQSSVPRSLETRTKRGFPHFQSDYGDGTRFGRRPNPAKIAGPVGFLHRTQFILQTPCDNPNLVPGALLALLPSFNVSSLTTTRVEFSRRDSRTTVRT